MSTYESPRFRRLRNDLAAMERLQAESSVLRFEVSGKPSQHYTIEFRGRSLARERGKVHVQERHQVEIRLGASYPRTMPEIRWLSPIYHPNISEIGMVCLGGYGTHWVPSLNLDELCGMLWDMARFHNYDIRSPYNREAALWVANQTTFLFPLDSRPLRDLRVALGRVEHDSAEPHPEPSPAPVPPPLPKPERRPRPEPIRPGDKARDFVRWFVELNESMASVSARPEAARDFARRFAELTDGSPSSATREQVTADSPDGVVILDMEIDLRPRPARPPQDEEIVFIE